MNLHHFQLNWDTIKCDIREIIAKYSIFKARTKHYINLIKIQSYA